MRIINIFAIIIYLLGLVYLLQPIRSLPMLSNAVLSNEPGDTWQNPSQRGFYTNKTRKEVLEEVQASQKFNVFGYKIPNYRLNYRPEEAHELVRDQLKSNYLEEIIYPFHSSLFVNGWEPKKSPAYANKPSKEVPDISIYGVPYEAKITLKPISSTPISRVLVWTMLFPVCFLVLKSLRLSFSNVK